VPQSMPLAAHCCCHVHPWQQPATAHMCGTTATSLTVNPVLADQPCTRLHCARRRTASYMHPSSRLTLLLLCCRSSWLSSVQLQVQTRVLPLVLGVGILAQGCHATAHTHMSTARTFSACSALSALITRASAVAALVSAASTAARCAAMVSRSLAHWAYAAAFSLAPGSIRRGAQQMQDWCQGACNQGRDQWRTDKEGPWGGRWKP
jgi:hypothetical protein